MTKKKHEEPLDSRNLKPEELLRYEIVTELGLSDGMIAEDQRSLMAKENGQIDGLVMRKKRKIKQEAMKGVAEWIRSSPLGAHAWDGIQFLVDCGCREMAGCWRGKYIARQPLRSGFITRMCGTAAAKATAVCLLTEEMLPQAEILTLKGILASPTVECVSRERDSACFRVQKDADNGPDVTSGAWAYASVERIPGGPGAVRCQSEEYPHLYLTGEEGIGLVTKSGLSCLVGEHAINPVPRNMIFEAVEAVCEQAGSGKMLLIRIKIPRGVELVASTLNPKLGIADGISVLGTSGIVEPVSEQALLDTTRLELHMKAVAGERNIIPTPGNYGESFSREELQLPLNQAVKCGSLVAEAMRMTAEEGVSRVLFVGRIGKLIKMAGGVEDAHSKYGDRRMEILTDCLRDVMSGVKVVAAGMEIVVSGMETVEADTKSLKDSLGAAAGNAESKNKCLEAQIFTSNTTEEALDYLQAAGCRDEVMEAIGCRILLCLTQWAGGGVDVEVVTFSTNRGVLYKSNGTEAPIGQMRAEELED